MRLLSLAAMTIRKTIQKRHFITLTPTLKTHLYNTLDHYNDIQKQLELPNISQNDYILLSKELGHLSQFAKLMSQYKEYEVEMKDLSSIISDTKCEPELKEIAKGEEIEIQKAIGKLEDDLVVLSMPRDDADYKNAILEFRPGAGGEEAALFAYDIYNMYVQYAVYKKWRLEVLSLSPSGSGGIREAICAINGENAYGTLKYESGVHRVQRVPETEVSNRTHTSTMSIVVLPQVEDVDVKLNSRDLKIDYYRSSGAGGQHVNKTESAVRITHLPTGIVVAMQDGRSQIQNKEKAMQILQARVYQQDHELKLDALNKQRSSQMGTMERCERIRTYNQNQDRITDHRIGMTVYGYDKVLSGIGLDPIIEKLHEAAQKEALAQFLNNFSS